MRAADDARKGEIWKGLVGTTFESFKFIGTPPKVIIDGKDNEQWFDDVKAALELINVRGETYVTLFRAVAACLQLGNFTFEETLVDEERTVITSTKAFKALPELLCS